MRPKPYDQDQVDIFEKHARNITAAAAEIGVMPATLRSRLIKWGVFTPYRGTACKTCGRPFKRNHARQVHCRDCSPKIKARKAAEDRRARQLARKKLPYEWGGTSRGLRRYLCRHYPECLDRAARVPGPSGLDCRGCSEYEQATAQTVVGGDCCYVHQY